MIGKLTIEEIDEVLTKNTVGRVGCHYMDRTYVVPITYAFDGKDIYAISYEGMKLEMMRKNKALCFEVDTMKDIANWRSVILWGTFEELNEPEKRASGFEILKKKSLTLVASIITHHNPTWPFLDNDINNLPAIVFAIHPETKTGRFERNTNVPLVTF